MDDVIELADGPTTWLVDRAFVTSRWTCLWGRGCEGILDHRAPELGQGCCSVGAELGDEDEAMMTAALAATLPAARFQYRAEADADGVFSDASRSNTRVVDGACIFLNRPGFVGGEGCALHLAALDSGESPIEWKPSVCWQLPIKVDWELRPDGSETAHLRAWRRADWGDDGTTMAWCCTEEPEAFIGDRPVIESLAVELQAVMGAVAFVELRKRLS